MLLVAVAVLIGLTGPRAQAAYTNIVVTTNSNWRWLPGTNEASSPTNAWRFVGFNDSGWALGAAPFHFGTNAFGGDDNLTDGTILSDMRGSYSCIFLRQKFVVTNAAGSVLIRMKLYFDDGFVVWLNGAKIRHTGVTTAEPSHSHIATASREFFSGFVDADAGAHTNLVEGTNVLAVQVFNAGIDNDDIRIDPELFISFVNPPSVQSVAPAPGSTLAELSEIAVTFDQPVTDVDETDLLVNGEPATIVSGSGNTFTFAFPRAPIGEVQVTWDPAHGIKNELGHPFTANGIQWNYTIPLAVLSLSPAPASTIASASEVSITFNDAVVGVNASDLLVNGIAATSVFGSGAGPYIFSFPPQGPGNVQFAWAAGHDIRAASSASVTFPGGSWTVTVNPAAFTGDIVINEFVAGNSSSNSVHDVDEDLEVQDWVELYNRGANSVRLLGWSLTDDPNNPGQWVFPDATIGPGQYLLVYTSGKDRRVVGGTNPQGRANQLHTSFKLNTFGEYLGLFSADSPRRVVSELSPTFPEQRTDYSYGRVGSNDWRYFSTPTPRATNGASTITQVVPMPHVNVARGVFDQPFTLVASCEVADATMMYTTNGSAPALNNGFAYTGPLTISGTTVFRIAAFRTNMLPSRVSTHTYLFFDNVISQPNNPGGYPSTWVTSGGTSYPADYEMDPEITTNAAYADLVKPALHALPAISIVMKVEDMFSRTNGIYVNPSPADSVRHLWERACSAEFIPTNRSEEGFQVDCGIRMQGNASRDPAKTSKHPMRLLFRSDYGPGNLDYQIYPDSPIKSWDSVVLRADFNNSWTHWDTGQRTRGTRLRDSWGKDTFRAMGQGASHSRYTHVFINGLYWGVYEFSERVDRNYAANYSGGNPDDYDVMASKPTEAIDGNRISYDAMIANVRGKDMRVLSNYAAALGYFDVTNYVEYLMLNFFGGNQDWGYDGNWNAYRKRAPGELYRWCVWDAERILEGVNDSRLTSPDLPSGLHTNLVNSLEYRLFFADRVHKHLFNGGALTTNQTIPRLLNRVAQLQMAIIAESARWGDNRRDVMMTSGGGNGPFFLYDKNNYWQPEVNRLANTYFPQRPNSFLNQLRSAGLYPNINAPVFSQHGGRVASGYALTITGSPSVYYTVNGDDPRTFGTGAISPSAIAYAGPVSIDSSVTVRARVRSGTNWSAMVEADFLADSLTSALRITEIMYNPVGGDAYEYIELQNTGLIPIDVGTYSFSGITFSFPVGFSINAGQRVVLGSGSSTNAFHARYPGVAVDGWFDGNLSNGGERIALLDRDQRTVLSVDYDDENGWTLSADGGGYSLELVNLNGDADDATSWNPSAAQNGTPGRANAAPAVSAVIINEVMAENVTFLNTNGGFPDWVELHNPGLTAASISGWSLSDDGNPRKFVFPPGTTIPAGGYLVVWCDSQFAVPGLHTGFGLSRGGDQVLLYNSATNRMDGIAFGPQVGDYTIGRVNGNWVLTVPSPGNFNNAASVASSSSIQINEWLANALPGGSDWIELYNPSATAPAAVQGMYLGTTAALFQIRSLTFIPRGGHLQLLADENPGPNHLDFKLAAAADTIILYSSTGAEIQRVTYGAQTEGVSQGRLPDGTSTIGFFPGSASPGASNYVFDYAGPVLNEVLARNSSSYSPWGTTADFLELHNPTASSFNLSGYGLSDDAGQVAFRFGAGVSIPANSYLVVWCDADRSASSNAAPYSGSFSLSGDSGGVYLFNPSGQVVNFVEYGPQVQNRPIGLSGGQWRLISSATPGGANGSAATLGSQAGLVINEWLAGGESEDWLELYNTGSLPVSLTGIVITDDPSVLGATEAAVAPLSFIAPNGWQLFTADGNRSGGRDHLGFSISEAGELLRIYSSSLSVIDSISFGPLSNNVSRGRLPDGAAPMVDFVVTPTPGGANYIPHSAIVVSEVLTHTDDPLEDAIEVQNTGAAAVDIGNWWISNSEENLKKYKVPAGTVLQPGGFAVFYENQFNPSGTGIDPSFTLNSARGDSVYVSEASAAGTLSGHRAQVTFGAAENAVSFGRHQGSSGTDFTAMALRTFGVDNPGTLVQFRGGTGRTNSYPKVGPVVINEINYHPVTPLTLVENPTEEFLELLNVTGAPVQLFDSAHPTNVWRLRGGISFDFPPNTTVPAGGYLVVVSFNPAINTTAASSFYARYGSNGSLVGPFSGRLRNSSDVIELYKPDAPQAAPHPDQGYVPYVLADRVVYSDTFPWPTAADGGGASLQRTLPGLYGNDAANWKAEFATAGRTNSTAGSQGPVISFQPESQTVAEGEPVTFTVTATGVPAPTYQWVHAGTNLPGATSSTFMISSADASHAGVYRVLVSNVAGTLASQEAILTVLLPPSISVQPQNLTAIAGTSGQLSVTASGAAPLHYQWRRNGLEVPGANNPQLEFGVVEPTDAGTYVVVITNSVGSVTSSMASVQVIVPPVITGDPQDATVPVNTTVTFQVSVSGSAPLTYQWRKNGNPIPGATDANYAIAAAQPSDEGDYSVYVSNDGGSATSGSATLVVSVAPVLGPPHPLSDGSFIFSVTGATNEEYVIEFSANLNTWTNLSTVTLTNGTLSVQDKTATNASTRFYRARTSP